MLDGASHCGATMTFNLFLKMSLIMPGKLAPGSGEVGKVHGAKGPF